MTIGGRVLDVEQDVCFLCQDHSLADLSHVRIIRKCFSTLIKDMANA